MQKNLDDAILFKCETHYKNKKNCLGFVRELSKHGFCISCEEKRIKTNKNMCVRRRDNIKNGKCMTCGAINSGKTKTCAKCLKKQKEEKKKLLSEGKCISCRKPNNNGKQNCDICTERRMQHKIDLVTLGFCYGCGDDREVIPAKYCNTCWAKNILKNARRRGVVTVTNDDVINQWHKCGGRCENKACNRVLQRDSGGGRGNKINRKMNNASLDKKDINLGYIPGNIGFLCLGCNLTKNNMTYEYFHGLGKYAGWI